ncbi:unnamed protein product [Lactuca virosa]|uniref:Uncharacterized protein n=1 Tax=Lactuca virosa TaxID=75947 RepID=A0AAU9LGR7_9ASTR|nr:unnamed protein product [Lactuca virosa]
MPSSEIEILSVFHVFSAPAYGDLLKLRKFVEDDVVSLSQPDAYGYYPLQWASVNNFPDVAQYIIEVLRYTSLYGKYSSTLRENMSNKHSSNIGFTLQAVCFCNHAVANQYLGEVIDAIGDCSIAIAFDTSYPKVQIHSFLEFRLPTQNQMSFAIREHHRYIPKGITQGYSSLLWMRFLCKELQNLFRHGDLCSCQRERRNKEHSCQKRNNQHPPLRCTNNGLTGFGVGPVMEENMFTPFEVELQLQVGSYFKVICWVLGKHGTAYGKWWRLELSLVAVISVDPDVLKDWAAFQGIKQKIRSMMQVKWKAYNFGSQTTSLPAMSTTASGYMKHTRCTLLLQLIVVAATDGHRTQLPSTNLVQGETEGEGRQERVFEHQLLDKTPQRKIWSRVCLYLETDGDRTQLPSTNLVQGERQKVRETGRVFEHQLLDKTPQRKTWTRVCLYLEKQTLGHMVGVHFDIRLFKTNG